MTSFYRAALASGTAAAVAAVLASSACAAGIEAGLWKITTPF